VEIDLRRVGADNQIIEQRTQEPDILLYDKLIINTDQPFWNREPGIAASCQDYRGNSRVPAVNIRVCHFMMIPA
jgi:hypothetical protein